MHEEIMTRIQEMKNSIIMIVLAACTSLSESSELLKHTSTSWGVNSVERKDVRPLWEKLQNQITIGYNGRGFQSQS